jgi:nitrite reductase (NO-forming)
LTKWLKSPEKMLQGDADAKLMLKEYGGLPMPNQNLSDREIRQYIRYFQWADQAAARTENGGGHSGNEEKR